MAFSGFVAPANHRNGMWRFPISRGLLSFSGWLVLLSSMRDGYVLLLPRKTNKQVKAIPSA